MKVKIKGLVNDAETRLNTASKGARK